MAGTTQWTVARKKASVWGTAVAVGATDGIKIMSESMGSGIPEPILDQNVGDSLSGGSYQGNVNADGNVVVPMRFEGIERDLAYFMGQAGTPTEVEVAVAYLHTLPFQPSNNGIFATWALDKGIGALGSDVHEWPSAKSTQLEVAHDGGKAIATIGHLVNKVERDQAVAVNDGTTLAAVTYPTDGLLALFSQLTVRLKEITGSEGNLAGSDDQPVSEARITVNRNISGDHVAGSGGLIDEPDTDGFPEAQLVLTFAQYTSAVAALEREAAIVQAGRVPKIYKAQVYWTGPLVAGSATNNYFLYFELPALAIADAPTNASSPGSKVGVEMTFNILTPQAATVPDGADWTWVTAGGDPFRARVQNGTNVDPLA
jgi:hypothetical protein